MTFRWKTMAVVTAVASVFALTSCAPEEQKAIIIGTSDASQEEWQVFEQRVKDAGINMSVRSYGEYDPINRALSDEQLDLNNFQHILYLASYNVESNEKLVPIGATAIFPMGLFYRDHKSIQEVVDAGQVVIPDDPTNQSRAINLLVQAGIVKLRTTGLLMPTPNDIDQANSKVSVTPVDASATGSSYHSGVPAVINNNFLKQSGISPEESIAFDDPNTEEAEPYVNVFVTTEDKKDDPRFQRLVEIWHEKDVQDAVQKTSYNTAIEVHKTPAELQAMLANAEEKIKNQNL